MKRDSQWLGAPAALTEDPSLVPSTHAEELTTAFNSSSRDPKSGDDPFEG